MPERSLTVCNFVTVDGRYEDDDHDIASFFTHQHPDYSGADDFDHYATGLLRRSDVVLLSGRRSALGNLGYWTSESCDPYRRAGSSHVLQDGQTRCLELGNRDLPHIQFVP